MLPVLHLYYMKKKELSKMTVPNLIQQELELHHFRNLESTL